MILEIEHENSIDLDRWLFSRARAGHSISAVKGPPPDGAVYEDGEPIELPVNIAWIDDVTGETFQIRYVKYLA